MHSNNDIKVLIFSSDHFINSFVELKDHFNFNFDFFEEDKKVNTSLNYKAYIIDGVTPPAPTIKTFLFVTSYLAYLIASSNPAISVL